MLLLDYHYTSMESINPDNFHVFPINLNNFTNNSYTLSIILILFHHVNQCNFYLVGGLNPSEKYESQLGWLFPTYVKIKNVPNHQPVNNSEIGVRISEENSRRIPQNPNHKFPDRKRWGRDHCAQTKSIRIHIFLMIPSKNILINPTQWHINYWFSI